MAFSRNTHHHQPKTSPPSSKIPINNNNNNNHHTSSNQKLFITCLSFLSFALLLLVLSFRPKPSSESADSLAWLGNRLQAIVRNDVAHRDADTTARSRTRIGLVNVDENVRRSYEALGLAEVVNVDFQRVSANLTWKMFFPTWVDEDGPPGSNNNCPELPMPRLDLDEPRYKELDVVVAEVPCGGSNNGSEGMRDVFRLQVNLVVANLVVAAAAGNGDRTVHVVFIGSCGPMPEIFRCDDMLTRVGDYWVYQPDLNRLREKVSMPVGSCQIAPPFGPAPDTYIRAGKESGRSNFQAQPNHHQKQAYVTVLHSSEAYVCGAIALAQSIKLTNSTKDLILLHDSSITPSSLAGLRSAGWTTRPIKPIRSTFAPKNSYNEWNYSKLRIWQIQDYDKVVFIDSDLLILRNMDHIFQYPQLSAGPNDRHLFNSGIMVIEPSSCAFQGLMTKTDLVASYNGGDQGFLNEMFTWWHRLPRKVNWLKAFEVKGDGTDVEDVSRRPGDEVYGLHLLGMKPWMCYRDYDCNWDSVDHHQFASDAAHRKWWEVYDAMPRKLQGFCGLSREVDERIRKGRRVAKSRKLRNGRWRIRVKDPRRDRLIKG
ncbi:unnamed protein product [Linum tenue]|uniref:Hexosyltransferase n=1 Tax=Linum tenue TaxID=586396 RepID=A0AAV0R4D1_9ROSI|nr:unnamed protein product [Linum tenue]